MPTQANFEFWDCQLLTSQNTRPAARSPRLLCFFLLFLFPLSFSLSLYPVSASSFGLLMTAMTLRRGVALLTSAGGYPKVVSDPGATPYCIPPSPLPPFPPKYRRPSQRFVRGRNIAKSARGRSAGLGDSPESAGGDGRLGCHSVCEPSAVARHSTFLTLSFTALQAVVFGILYDPVGLAQAGPTVTSAEKLNCILGDQES